MIPRYQGFEHLRTEALTEAVLEATTPLSPPSTNRTPRCVVDRLDAGARSPHHRMRPARIIEPAPELRPSQ